MTSQNINIEPYQSDSLFLLMGENPLPNCVAAISLLRPGGTAYLVHTTFTQKQAEFFSKVLYRDFPAIARVVLISLGDNQTDAAHIRTTIQKAAASLSGAFGMNYTGGTKTMAVHAYRALMDTHPDAVFSYLDPHTSDICIDREGGECLRFKVTPPVSLQQIFNLHGLFWRVENPPRTIPLLPDAAAALALACSDPDIARDWRNWCNAELRGQAKNERDFWLEEEELQGVPPLRTNRIPPEIQPILQGHLGASERLLSLEVARQRGFSTLTDVCAWLDGIWLEHYVLHQVQQVAARCGVHDSGMAFHILDPKRPDSEWDKFEFDVAFMVGYQLFAVSCTTTDKKGACKQKLFEASLRARQLGGGEARVALVCFYDYPRYVREELETVTRNRKLAVFGRPDLPVLGERIMEWVETNG